jgi:acetyltransferase-like isoleucine patch superfamily enzyme
LKKPLLKRCLNRVLNLVVRLCPGAMTLRPLLHRARGVTIGRGVFIGDDVYIDGEYPEMIEIQDGAAISIRANIIAHTKGPGRVIIEKEAFIGPQVIILCNGGKTLTIGEGAIISAGCVISRNVPPRTVVAPAPNLVVGQATISLAAAATIEEFWSGLKPVLTKAARKPTPSPASPAGAVPQPGSEPAAPIWHDQT